MFTSTSACGTARTTKFASEGVYASPITKTIARSQKGGTRSSRQDPTPEGDAQADAQHQPTAGVA